MTFIDKLIIFFAIASEYVLMVSITAIQTLFYSKNLGLHTIMRGKRLVAIIFLIGSLEATIQLISLNFVGYYSIRYLYLAIVFLYTIVFMTGKWKERIFYGIVSLITFLFSVLFTSVLLKTNNIMLVANSSSWLYSMMITGIIISIYALLTFIIFHLTSEGKHYIPQKYWHGITICFFILLVGLYNVYNFHVWIVESQQLYTFLTVFSFSLFSIWILMYFIFYFACRYYSKVAEANELAVQNIMIEKYFLQKQIADEKIQMLRHDLKHSLMQWSKLANEKGDIVALQSIDEYEKQLSETILINVENESANAILNQKSWEAEKAGVKFLVEGVCCEDLSISKLDLCNLLGNLLDNAIEAASKEGVGESLRSVKLTIRRKGNLLLLVVENGYAIEPVIRENKFVTNKKETDYHGIGTRSIRFIADKYDGVVENSYQNNWFVASVLLNGYHTDISNKN